MGTLIGIADAQIGSRQLVSYQSNKIGGLPDLPVDDVNVSPECPVCGELLSLVVQLYCPLEGSNYHRSLYVFGCSSPPCWNRTESWIAIRCQLLDKQSQSEQENTGTGDTSAEGLVSGGGDWGVDADDWGVDSGDWDHTQDTREDQGIDEVMSLTETGDHSSKAYNNDDPEARNEEFKVIDKQMNVGSEPKTSNIIDDLPLQQMCLDDVDDDIDASADGTDQHIYVEDPLKDISKNRLETLQKLPANDIRPSDLKKVLVPYFIDVFDEPANQVEADSHVTELLRKYQRQEGLQDIECSSSSGGQQSGGAEKYEKTTLTHRDLVFHKFLKRVSVCPQQCVRYEWGGSPIFMRHTYTKTPMRCEHCQGRLVFEVQLMPALVNSLKFPDYTGTPLEFGTVIVYTCEQSCWSGGDSYRTEALIVQTDPDHDRFNPFPVEK